MKYLITITNLFLGLLAIAQSDSLTYQKHPSAENVLSARYQALRGESQYITADDLKQHGLVRLSEVLLFANKINLATINGDKQFINVNGSSGYQQQEVVLLINGQRVFLPVWNEINLNLLGVAVNQIAYVQIVQLPQIIGGQFVGKGAINIVLRTDYKGLTYTNYIQYGNPTKDPGPAKNLPNFATPNVDNLGLVWSHLIGYYGAKGHVNISHHYQQTFARDTTLLNRFLAYNGNMVNSNLYSTRIDAALQQNDLLFEIGLAVNNHDDNVFNTYLNYETPYKNQYLEYRFGLTRKYTKNKYYKLQVVKNNVNFNPLNNQFSAYSYNATQLNGEFGFEYTNKRKLINKLRLGHTILQQYINNTSNGYQLQHKPFLSFTNQSNKKTHQQLLAQVDILNNTINPNLSLKYQKNSSIINSWSFIASYQQSQTETTLNQVWLFYNLNKNVVLPQNAANLKASKLYTADYLYHLNFGTNFRLTFNPALKYFSNQHDVAYATVLSSTTHGENALIETGNYYTTSLSVHLHYNVLKNFWCSIDYFGQKPRNTTSDIKNVLQQNTNKKLTATGQLTLPGRFSLATRVMATSKTNWLMYDANNMITNATINAFLLTDFTLNKALASNVLHASVTIRNTFNAPEKYHPMGAEFGLRMLVTLRLQLNEIGKTMKKLF